MIYLESLTVIINVHALCLELVVVAFCINQGKGFVLSILTLFVDHLFEIKQGPLLLVLNSLLDLLIVFIKVIG